MGPVKLLGLGLLMIAAAACGRAAPGDPDAGSPTSGVPDAGVVPSAQCSEVSGNFTNTVMVGLDCFPQSPALLCTHGTLEGDLQGGYDFDVDSIVPSPTPDEPDRLEMTGRSRITLDGGEMSSDDVAYLTPNPLGPSSFHDVIDIVSGTGAYAGATGQLAVQGTLDLITQQGSGTYDGQICLPPTPCSDAVARAP